MADPQPQPEQPKPQPQQQPQQPRRPTAEILPPEPDLEIERSLGELAVNQELTVVQERGLFGDLITAQPVKRYRDDAKILKKIDVWAAIAGPRWFYRYPVRNRRTGKVDYIEGPSVKCTNAVARLFGNCSIESRTMRLDDKTYICYSRFGDLETGFSMTKGQLVPRSATLGGEDEERRVAIAHNIGQSKSQRNVTDAALGDFTQRGFEGAKSSIVERIGRNIEKARERIVNLLLELGRDKGINTLVTRVEYITGRRVGEWLAPDIAGIHAELEAIREGFASIDEQWPLPAPPEPRRGNGEPETTAAAAPPAAAPPAAATTTGMAAAASGPSEPTPGSAPPPSSPSVNETAEVPKPGDTPVAGDGKEGSGNTSQPTPPPAGEPTHHPHTEVLNPASADVAGERTEGSTIGTSTPPPVDAIDPRDDAALKPGLRNWKVPPDVIGQDNIIRVLGELLDMAESDADQDEFERQNAERIAKITGVKGQQLRARFADKRRQRGGGDA
jgi:hypothetical protein